jgi:hypothetical protein
MMESEPGVLMRVCRESSPDRCFQFLSQSFPHLSHGGLGFLVFGQQFGGVAMGVVHDIGVLDIEIVATRGDVRDGHAPGELALLALLFLAGFAPPLLLRFEFFELNGFGFVVVSYAGRVGMLVVPDSFI